MYYVKLLPTSYSYSCPSLPCQDDFGIVKINIGLKINVPCVAGVHFIGDWLKFRKSFLPQNIINHIVSPNEPIKR